MLVEIRNGDIDVENYIRENTAIDNYVLFPEEMAVLNEICTYEWTDDGQHSENEDKECIICMDAFLEGIQITSYPMCNHKYHQTCLMEWLKTKTNCPMCRRGVRSSLYRRIQNRPLLLQQDYP